MLQLVSDLLDVSKIATGELTLDIVRVDINVLLTQVCESSREAARAKRSRLRLVGPAVPVTAWVDGRRIEQVVQNLLANAIRFTTPGHPMKT